MYKMGFIVNSYSKNIGVRNPLGLTLPHKPQIATFTYPTQTHKKTKHVASFDTLASYSNGP
jgi:hypothetical protein